MTQHKPTASTDENHTLYIAYPRSKALSCLSVKSHLSSKEGWVYFDFFILLNIDGVIY